MPDPLGLINATRNVQGANLPRGPVGTGDPVDGPSFKNVLLENLNAANRAQQDATRAVEDLAQGKSDVENVVLAAKKAETAFQMLQALRNRVVEAYDEIKQMRV